MEVSPKPFKPTDSKFPWIDEGDRTFRGSAAEILETLGELNRRGIGILLVEQKAPLALRLARRVYVLALGRIAAELPAADVRSHHDLAQYYLG